MGFFDTISVIKEVMGWAKQAWSFLTKWWHKREIKKRIEKMREGLDERDTRKIEEALGHEHPGDRSNLPGVRIRRRKGKSTDLVD